MRYGRSSVKDYKAGILTNPKDIEKVFTSNNEHNEDLFDIKELICSGEGSDSPWNQWEVAFYLLKSTKENIYALKLVHYGDPDNTSEDDSENYSAEIVAVLPTLLTDDEDVIVNDLLAKYWEDGGYQVDAYISLGRYTLLV